MERGIRRLPGNTAQQRQEIEAVQEDLWNYYRQLRDYQDQPSETQKQRLQERFDEIFGQPYPHHYGLNLAMQQFCAHKEELLRVLDTPQVPLHTNAAEADIREYVTRRKISGGTRHDDGRRARDTFTGLKKTLASSPIRSGSTCCHACRGMTVFPICRKVIRTRMTQKLELAHSQ